MAKHTHTLRKKIRKAINRSDNIDELINMMVALATNKAEEYGHKSVPPAVMRATAKDLVEFGISSEKDIQDLLSEESEDDSDENPTKNKISGVVVKMTAD